MVDYLVEAVGIEPTSESTFTKVSPSAADNLLFASRTAYQQAVRLAISLFPLMPEPSSEVFLYHRRLISDLQVNQRRRAAIMQLMRNYYSLRLNLVCHF